jgi:regulator of RNase E activity RraA/CMP-N-acetylneuraminic acid synthetase
MKIAAFVPAKGTSQRIPNKNLQVFDGEYLFKRKLRQLLECEEIDEVWLDSESEEIHQLASDLPIKHLVRDVSLANNSTDGHSLFENHTRYTDADIVVQVLCTSPFLDKNVIDPALKELKNSNYTSLVAVTENKLYLWENNSPIYGDKIPNSVDLQSHIIESMGLYAVKTNGTVASKRYTDNPLLYRINQMESIDINDKEDLILAKYISAGQRLEDIQKLKAVSKVISSCMLSDICKEHNIEHFLSSNLQLLSGESFLGYAKTLKLSPLEESKKNPAESHWRGIFDALESYKFIEPGDVIVVSNDVPDKAYFGDLNATFAHKNGAVGVIVDGHTRDIDRVSEIGLPVFARGRRADDIRYEGTLESMNMPVTINGVVVRNNDIIFGDSDGAICIPREKWEFVLSEVKKTLKKEMMVKFEATFGGDPIDILNTIGEF